MAEKFNFEQFMKREFQGTSLELPSGPPLPATGNISDQPFVYWRETPNVIQPDDGYEKFKLHSGNTEIEVVTNEKFAQFKWDAQLPEVLQKLSADDLARADDRILNGLFPFMLAEMPVMLGLAESTDDQTKEGYMASSSVSLKFKGEQDSRVYRLSNDTDRLRFVINYVGRNESIDSMKIVVGQNKTGAAYILDVYHARRNTRDSLRLSLPVETTGVRACTPELGIWVLKNHVRAMNDLGNLETPGTSLGVSMMQNILFRTMERKKRRPK